ncbi:MAG: toprim domain-containing protein [Candidatus Woesearchaeota archaeon]
MITKQFQHTTHSIILEIKTIGIIDKTDIIGTLYKQLSNVLTKSANFEELVKTGKIGNLEISIKTYKGNSKAQCIIPTNLDIQNVCLLAAKCEQITKIGHTKGEIRVLNIIHTQEDIENQIHKRAQELEEKFFKNTIIPETSSDSSKKSTSKTINTKTLTSQKKSQQEVIELIPNCYSTPNIELEKVLLFVEGRSDVRHLVYHGFTNIISVNGSHLDILQIKKLPWFKEKIVYLVLDGDSSAQKIAQQLQEHFTFEQVIFAPNNKEITELKKYELNRILKRTQKINNKNENTHNKDISKKDGENKILSEEETEKQYFTKEEYFVIENYLQAVEGKGRVVGFDEGLGLLFDIPLQNFKETSLENVYLLIIDALFENSLSKKINSQIKQTQLSCIIARGIPTPLKNIKIISFNEFKASVEG